MADVCRAAGVQKGSFYHFFPSKRDLILATVGDLRERHCELLDQVFDPALGPASQVEQLFQRFYATQRASVTDCGAVQGCVVASLTQELADQDEGVRAELQGLWTAWTDRLTAALARPEGGRVIEDPRSTAVSLIALLEGATLLAKAQNDASVILARIPDALAILHARSVPLQG